MIVTCTGCQADPSGTLFTAVTYFDGESFYSFVFHESDVSGATGENARTTAFELEGQLTDLWRASDGTLSATDASGTVHRGRDGSWRAERVGDAPLTAVWGLSSGDVYVCGDDGRVCRRGEAGWVPVGEPLGGKLLSVRGRAPDDLFVCGEDGLFAHFDGQRWRRITLATKAVLNGLVCLGDEVLVSGHDGALFRGTPGDLRAVSSPFKALYSIASWRDRVLFAGGGDGVVEFSSDGTLTAIKNNIAVYRLGGCPEYLTACGGNLAARFDGSGWFGARYA